MAGPLSSQQASGFAILTLPRFPALRLHSKNANCRPAEHSPDRIRGEVQPVECSPEYESARQRTPNRLKLSGVPCLQKFKSASNNEHGGSKS